MKPSLLAGVVVFLLGLMPLGASADLAGSFEPGLASDSVSQAAPLASMLDGGGGAGPAGGREGIGPHGPEVDALRTAMSRTYEGPAGQAETVISTQPVNYLDGNGHWSPINDNLVAQGALLANVADADHAILPDDLGETPVSVERGGDAVAFRLRGATGSAHVSGSVAAYPNALSSTTVELAAVPSGVKETLSLEDSSAPAIFRYDLTARGALALVPQRDGSIIVRDRDGIARFTVPAPSVRDAAGVVGAAHYDLTPEPGGWELALVVDPDWLSSAARAWPVTVDPTFLSSSASSCTLKRSAPTTSFCTTTPTNPATESTLSGGVWKDETLGLLKWNLESIPGYARVDSASMSVYASAISSKGSEQFWGTTLSGTLYPVATAWDSTATWSDAKTDPVTEWGPHQLDLADESVPISFRSECTHHIGLTRCATLGEYETQANITGIVQNLHANGYGGNFGIGLSAVIPENGKPEGRVAINDWETAKLPMLTVLWNVPTGELRQFKYDTYPLNDTSSVSVNVRTGNLEYKNDDLTLPAGPPPVFSDVRMYDSMRIASPVDLSEGWKFSAGRDTTCTNCSQNAPSAPSLVDSPNGAVYNFSNSAKARPAFNTGYETGLIAAEGEDAVMSPVAPFGHGKAVLSYNSGLTYQFGRGGTTGEESRPLYGVENRIDRGWSLAYSNQCGAPPSTPAITVRRLDDTGEGPPPTGMLRLYVYTSCTTNQVTEISDSTGRTWQYGYNSNGLLSSYIDPNNKTTKYSYTQYGTGNPASTSLLSQITTAGERTLKITYTNPETSGVWGRVEAITQTIDKTHTATTKYAHLAAGVAPCGASEESTTVIDPLNRTETDCFDSYGRPTHYYDYYSTFNGPYGNDRDGTTFQPGTLSHPITTNPAGKSGPSIYQTTSGYEADDTGRLLTSQAPTGETTVNSYTDAQNPYLPTVVTDAEGQQQDLTYSANGELTHVKALKTGISQPEEAILTWASGGEIVSSQLGPVGTPVTEYKYDAVGNLKEIIPPQAATNPVGATKLTYDALDRVATKTDGRGQTTSYEYDPDNRLTAINFADGSGIRYTYDADGNLTKRVACAECGGKAETTQTATYMYDGLGDQLTATLPGIPATVPVPGSPGEYASVVYAYNVDQSLASVTDAGGIVSYTYNHAGLVASVSDPTTSPHSIQFHYDLDDATNQHPRGVLEWITYPNSSGETALTTTYQEDNDGRMSSIVSKKTGETNPVQSLIYDYTKHALGQGSGTPTALRQWVTNTAGEVTGYTYDYLERLTSATTYASNTSGAAKEEEDLYCYNSCAGHPASEEGQSNLLRRTMVPYSAGKAGTPVIANYTYDVADQLLSIAGNRVGHDAAGNDTGHPVLEGEQTIPGNRTVELSFNSADQLSQINTPLGVGGEPIPTALTYDDGTNTDVTAVGGTRLENTSLGIAASLPGGTASYYTRTPEGELLDVRKGSTTSYYLTDDRGTVTGTTSTNGTSEGLLKYDPWGNTSSTVPTFGYLGAYQALGGLDHFGRRYYDPNTGRWTQPDSDTDPGEPLQANPYTYAGDDPVNESDPEGTCPFDQHLDGSVEVRGQYTYVEICGQHGRTAGKRVGYFRVLTREYRTHSRSLIGRVVEGTVGATVAIAGAFGGTLCIVATDAVGTLHCAIAASGPILAGGLAVGNSLGGFEEG